MRLAFFDANLTRCQRMSDQEEELPHPTFSRGEKGKISYAGAALTSTSAS